MVIACPACQTRYVVPDSAIGVEGRTVRCAKCRHSWFQDGAEPDAVAAAPPPLPAETAAPDPVPAAPDPDADPAPRPAAAAQDTAAPAFDETVPPSYDHPRPPPAPLPAQPDEDELVSRFDRAPLFRPRRNTLRIWTWAAALFAVLALGTVIVMRMYGTPTWWPIERPTWGAVPDGLVLSSRPESYKWRELANDSWMFSTRIEVRNTARETRRLPPILVVMSDEGGREVYSWVVRPPQPTLAPGEAVVVDEARVDVPRSAAYAEIGWARL